MSVVQALIAAVIGAIAGHLFGKGRARIATVRHDLLIHVTKDTAGKYTSKTTPPKKGILGFDVVYWDINDKGSNALPAGSTVRLKFTNGNPLASQDPNDGGTRTILSLVKLGQPRQPYPYQIYYNAGAGDILLEDPELIIEGDQNIVIK